MKNKDDKSFDVGYRKPPAHTKFKKGKSGNPRGRPKGSRNIKTLFKEKLDEVIIITENGRKKTVSKQEALATVVINKALSGDIRSINLLLPFLDNTEDSSESLFGNEIDQQLAIAITKRLRNQSQDSHHE